MQRSRQRKIAGLIYKAEQGHQNPRVVRARKRKAMEAIKEVTFLLKSNIPAVKATGEKIKLRLEALRTT